MSLVIVLSLIILEPYFCGNKAVHKVTTSSFNKKRKLSPVVSEPLPSIERASESPSSLASSSDHPSNPSSPDTPRVPSVLPRHLLGESGRSPTPEPSNTGSSSPSGAYAGLSLDSEGSEQVSGSEGSKRPGAPHKLQLRGGAATSVGSYRAASPAKRRASAMSAKDGDTRMNGQSNEPAESEMMQETNKASKRGSKGYGTMHNKNRRDSFMDALSDDATKPSLHTLQSAASSNGVEAVESAPGPESSSIDDQISQVMSLVKEDWLSEGLKGYVVSCQWLARVTSKGSDSILSKFGKEAREGPIGPVDNSSIWMNTDGSTDYKDEKGEAFVSLKPGLVLSEDYEVLPQAAWDLIIKWYGMATGSPIITRYCHNTSINEFQPNLIFEITPPIFTILKLPDTTQGVQLTDIKERDAIPVTILASRYERYQSFLKRAKAEAGIDIKTKVRAWRILGGLGDQSPDGMLTPAQSRSNSPAPGLIQPVSAGSKLVLDVNTFAQLQLGSQRELVDNKDETNNANYNGKSTIDFVGLGTNGVIVLEEMVGGPAGGEWVSDASTAKARMNGVPISVTKNGATTVRDTLKPNAANSRATSPVPSGVMTRGRQNKTARSRGTVGLGNLGNTCYMNSALQCVRSVEELTMYFLEDHYKPELNPSNPLAHNGDVAKTYAKLLHDMYDPKVSTSFTPRNFKNVVGKYGPSFSGYQQQDSQEFLLFLLDGLQEDLNRIHKKPYIEKPDSTDEMVNDPVALKGLADKCWEIYKARNDSVITDLFAGMYKSTVVCPVCDKVSIIFDPFNNLTLQLPIQNIWSKDIWFFPLGAAPFKVAVDIDKNSPWSGLCEYVGTKVNVDSKRLILAEIWQHKLYKIFEMKKAINEDTVSEADIIACFELEDVPTNWPAPKKSKKSFTMYPAAEEEIIPEGESPLAEQMLVTVFHRRNKVSTNRYTPSKEFFGSPSLMVINRKEALDFDSILRKTLSRAQTMTSRDFLKEEELGAAEDADTVVLNGDDSSDGRLQTESLESEDGMVDISMKEDTDTTTDGADTTPKFHRKPIAPMLKPGSFITQGARSLFEMRTFSPGGEMVPLGFQAFMSDEDKKLPSIASRMVASSRDEIEVSPELPVRTQYQQRLNQIGDSPPSSDEDEEPPSAPSVHIPAANDGSDSDGLPEIEQITQNPFPTSSSTYSFGNRRNSKIKNTYSRKDKRKAKVSSSRQSPALESGGRSDEPLVRLGECVVLDWTDDGYDALFGGSTIADDEEGPSRGLNTWDEMSTFPDPELEEKRNQRMKRRKTGFSLGDCLDEFGKPETLSESDTWYCPRCKEHRRATKKFELWKTPDILVIHLKRFSSQGRFNNKLDVLVDFPLEGLDLTSRLATTPEEGKSPVYELFAVDNHYGGLGGGHYTAYAKNFIDKRWYEYNDAMVTPKKDEAVITSAGYLLFYRRQSTIPLGGPSFEQVMSTTHESPSNSQANSRAPSPTNQSGEGKRLDDSSRNGSSSALRGVGAAHQAGGGGPVEQAAMMTRMDDEELPPYSTLDPAIVSREPQLEDMNMEDDEGVDMNDRSNVEMKPSWSFDYLENLGTRQMPPNSDADERESAQMGSDQDDRMADFADDEGTTMNVFGTPPNRPQEDMYGGEPYPTVEYDDEEVAEVRVSPAGEDEDGEVKMD